MQAIGVIGWSGAGKTTLIEAVVERLTASGHRVATIKHAHKRFDMDREGKDSFRHRAAGARQVLVTSPDRWALLTEHADEPPPDLEAALALLDPADVVLVEGYRGAAIPKLEVWRSGRGGDPVWPDDPNVVAVASDVAEDALPASLGPCRYFHLDDAAAIAPYIEALAGLEPAAAAAEGPRS